jgi:hypothetical protein
MDKWMDCQWWSSTPARGPQDRPYVLHGLSLMSQSVCFCIRSRPKKILFCIYLVFKTVCSYRLIIIVVFWVSTDVGLINPNYNSNSRLVLNPSFPSNGLWVWNGIVLLNQKKVRKIQTSKEKPYLTRDSNPEPLG